MVMLSVLQMLELTAENGIFMPRLKMAEGHIEFTLSVCARACVFFLVRLYVPESCPTHNFIVHGGI